VNEGERERERERIKNYPEFTPDGFCVVLTPSRRVTSRRLLIVRHLLTTGSPVHDRTSSRVDPSSRRETRPRSTLSDYNRRVTFDVRRHRYVSRGIIVAADRNEPTAASRSRARTRTRALLAPLFTSSSAAALTPRRVIASTVKWRRRRTICCSSYCLSVTPASARLAYCSASRTMPSPLRSFPQ